MFYFFHRDGDCLRCEIRFDDSGDGYELVMEGPDTCVIERFTETEALNRRWTELEQRLLNDGWSGPEGTRARPAYSTHP